jgi:hypothetical protein
VPKAESWIVEVRIIVFRDRVAIGPNHLINLNGIVCLVWIRDGVMSLLTQSLMSGCWEQVRLVADCLTLPVSRRKLTTIRID